MIFVKYDTTTNEIIFRHNLPFHADLGLKKSKEDLLKEGALVEVFPDVSAIEGKKIIYKYNQQDNTVYSEYVNPDNVESTNEIEQLRSEVNELREQNNHLVDTLDMVLIDLIPSLLEGGEPV